MERITITIDESLLRDIDALSAKRGYQSRSEIFRDMARAALAQEAVGLNQQLKNEQMCYGSLTYLYDHSIRDLPNRLTDNHHDHQGLSVATTHVHASHDDCLEVSILAGTVGDLRRFADSVISQRGVRYGNLHIVPVAPQRHSHGHSHHHGDDGDHSR